MKPSAFISGYLVDTVGSVVLVTDPVVEFCTSWPARQIWESRCRRAVVRLRAGTANIGEGKSGSRFTEEKKCGCEERWDDAKNEAD